MNYIKEDPDNDPKWMSRRWMYFDTEEITPSYDPLEVIFFQRQLGQCTAWSQKTKTDEFTNLQQPGQICNPYVFDIMGFGVTIDASESLQAMIAKNGAFELMYRQYRFGPVPLRYIKCAPVPLDRYKENAEMKMRIDLPNAPPSQSLPYTFDSTCPIRVSPYDSFQARIVFSDRVHVNEPVRLICFLDGRQFSPSQDDDRLALVKLVNMRHELISELQTFEDAIGQTDAALRRALYETSDRRKKLLQTLKGL